MRDVASGADGTYSIKSVAPGTYQLLVVDESEMHTITSEPGTEDFDDLAETVEVRAKEKLTRDLKVRAVGGEVRDRKSPSCARMADYQSAAG
jgi:hypothetical protein